MLHEIESFRKAIISAGFNFDCEIIPDGEIHRFHIDGDKQGSENGWYVLHADGIPSGAYGSWKDGKKYNWSSQASAVADVVGIEQARNIRSSFHQRKLSQEEKQQKTEKKALELWKKSSVAEHDHPYLVMKNIASCMARQLNDLLVLPITNINGKIVSLQFIRPDTSKRLLKAGAKKGNFIPITKRGWESRLIICEGFATGATLAQAYPDASVIAAIDAGNLEHVALSARRHKPNGKIIICADDDRETAGNPGLTKARIAAQSANASLIIPNWPEDAPKTLTDFNDLECWLSKMGKNIEGNDKITELMPIPREQREQREQPSNDGGSSRSHNVPTEDLTGNKIGSDQPTIMNVSEIQRPCYLSHEECFELAGEKMKPGLYWHGISDNAPKNEWICSPLRVMAITSSTDKDNFGRLLQFQDCEGQPHEWPMPMRILKGNGEELITELLDQGLTLNKPLQKHIISYIMFAKSDSKITAIDKVGWYNNSFVFPNKTIGEDNVVFQSEIVKEDDFKTKGSIDGWIDGIGKACSANIPLMVSVCAALAGPLLEKVNRQQGGGVIHWFGDSSSGKSTAVEIAASVWGAPQFVRSWNATANGLEGIATMRNDTCLILDEIDEALPLEVSKIAYMIANGQGKQRAARTGLARKIQRWRFIGISTGERTLAAVMREIGKRTNAGQSVRVLSIPADFEYGVFSNLHGFENGRIFSDHLKAARLEHYGHIGPEFVRRLIEDKRDLKKALDKLLAEFEEGLVENLQKRAATLFAIIGLAGELGIEFGLLPWPVGSALEAAIETLDRWKQYQGEGQTEDKQILQSISNYFDKHGDSRFSLHTGIHSNGPPIHNRAGWYINPKGDNEEGRVYMVRAIQLAEIAGGFENRRIVEALHRAKWLVVSDPGRFTKRVRTPHGSKHYYHIRVQEELS